MTQLPTPAQVESLARRVVTEAAAAAGSVAVVLGSLAAALPSLHVPAADTALVTAATGLVTAFISWARNHGYVTTKTVRQ